MEHEYECYDKDITQTIAFRKVTLHDIEKIHQWMNEAHVYPFWNLNLPFEKFETHLEKALADHHHTLYIGLIDDEPMSYWEAYWVKGDVVEETYDAESADQGVHLLIGEKSFLGKGYALPMLKAMVRFLFRIKETEKVIAEPDISNETMIHVFKKCGFKPVKRIRLPDKTGLLMFCEREEFEKRWNNEQSLRQHL